MTSHPLNCEQEGSAMKNLARAETVAALRARIADIERRPALAETATPAAANDAEGFPVFPGGLVQEIFTDERRNGGAALGFTLAQARGLLTSQRSVVVYLQLANEAQEMGLPYGPGLISLGFAPEALVLIRPATVIELLWAAEEALACQAVAAVVADIAGQPKALNFTASRRLSLRSTDTGASMFFLRYGHWREASAAHLRWQVLPVLSAHNRLDVTAPGRTRWQARLERGSIAIRQKEYLLGWNEDGFRIDTHRAHAGPLGRTPVSRPVSTGLGDRLSETAGPRPGRAAGAL